MAESKRKEKDSKKIKKKVNILRMKFRDIELRPCHGDKDLRQKDYDLTKLRQEIHRLEKEINQFAILIPCLGTRG